MYNGMTPLRAKKQRDVTSATPAKPNNDLTPAEMPAAGTDRHRTTAEMVILAGKLRRGEIADDANSPEPGSLAAQILEAGRIRRSEQT